jgi:predicted CopG family antitoxin
VHYTYKENGMQKKLTITIDEQVYNGLHRVIGRRKISKFIESTIRPHVINPDLCSDYREMAQDEAREADALEWIEGTLGDMADEAR